jgi:hypothetical protein
MRMSIKGTAAPHLLHSRRTPSVFIRKAALWLLAAAAPLGAQKAPAVGWTLSFADDFAGSQLELSKWTPYDLAGGRAYSADAAEVKGGVLRLAAKPGLVTTYGKFAQTYGLFEVRCRIPDSAAARVAVRLLPIPSGNLPSIHVSSAGGWTTFENHWGTEQTERSYGDAVAVAPGRHTLAIDWERDHISWLVDGKEKMRSIDGVPRQPLYVTIEASGDRAAAFEVESVRVYRKNDARGAQSIVK